MNTEVHVIEMKDAYELTKSEDFDGILYFGFPG